MRRNGEEEEVVEKSRRRRRRREVVQVALRGGCLATSATAVAVMLAATEEGVADIYGFKLTLYSKWSFSPSYQYVVGACSATMLYSLFQLCVGAYRLLTTRSPIPPPRLQAWLCFTFDQLLGYLMVSAGSAGSGVTNLNKTGIRHTPLPDFCKTLSTFCNHVALSLLLVFISFLFLASSSIINVLMLSTP